MNTKVNEKIKVVTLYDPYQGINKPLILKWKTKLYNSVDMYKEAIKLLAKAPMKKTVSHLMVYCYDLSPLSVMQLELDDFEREKRWRLSKSMDVINDRYGEYIVAPALMMGLTDQIIDRVPFGGVKELEDIYSSQN